MNKLSGIYAQSLFELAQEAGKSEEILEDAMAVLQAVKENPEFIRLLATPAIAAEEKQQIIDKVFENRIDKTLLHYLKVISDRKDAGVLAESLEQYEKLYNDYNGIRKAVAITAVPMAEELQQKLTVKLEALTGKKIILTNQVDESCLGGVVLRLGDLQTDGSIAGKLKELNRMLKAN